MLKAPFLIRCLLFFVIISPNLSAQTWLQTTKLVQPGMPDAFYGDLSINNGRILAGNPVDNCAYITEKDGSGLWVTKKITEANPPSYWDSEHFGHSAAVYGDIAVIGSPTNTLDENNTYPGFDTGAVYVFERDNNGNWIQKKKLVTLTNSYRTDYEFLGTSVAIYKKTIAAGAEFSLYSPGAANSPLNGSIYIYEQDNTGTWNKTQKFTATDNAAGDCFGTSIAFDDNTMVVGAPKEDEDATGGNTVQNSGSIYIFEKNNNGQWIQKQKLVPSYREKDGQFGSSVSLSGNTIIVNSYEEDSYEVNGSGRAYVFTKNSQGIWKETQRLHASDYEWWEYFGGSVSVQNDLMVVGAAAENDDELGLNDMNSAGAFYIFLKDASGNWQERKKVCVANRNANQGIGLDVDIDGTTIYVKGGSQGALYIFDKTDLPDQQITFGPIPAKKISDGSFQVSATASSGLPVVFSSSNPLIAYLEGNTVKFSQVGTVDIIARQPGSNQFDPAAPVYQKLIINKQDQEIIFPPIPVKTVGDAPFYLDAHSTVYNSITFTSSNPQVASITPLYQKVTILKRGTTVITASSNGDSNTNPAVPKQQILTVKGQTQTLTFNELPTKNYGDAPFSLTATSSASLPVTFSSSNPSVASVSGAIVTIHAAGTVNIKAFQPGNDTYDSASVIRTLNITGATSIDTQPPLLNSKNPVNGAVNVSTGTSLQFIFSETIVLSNGSVRIYNASTDAQIAAIALTSSNTLLAGTQATVTPPSPLPGNTAIYIKVDNGTFKDLVGNAFIGIQDKNWFFTTASSIAAPVATAATSVSATGFIANWNGVSGATSYRLDVSSDNFTTFLTGYNSKIETGTSQVVTGLTVGTSYQYRVRAITSSGTSANSNVISVTALPSSVAAPVATAASNITSTSFTANWNSVTGATGYQLDISSDNFATFLTGYNSKVETGTSQVVSGLTLGTTYQYRVRASIASVNSANSNIITVITSTKSSQTITFNPIPDVAIGDPAITLSATASSGLPVSFVSKITPAALTGTSFKIVLPGRDTITASQAGNATYFAAVPVIQTFCINPAKPVVTMTTNNGTVTLTSSTKTGNQWYLNGVPISGATGQTLDVVKDPSEYTVRVKVDDCLSAPSSIKIPTTVVTGDITTLPTPLTLYPNPTRDFIFIKGLREEVASASVIDLVGQHRIIELEPQGDNIFKGDIKDLADGLYILQVSTDGQMQQIKFIKQ